MRSLRAARGVPVAFIDELLALVPEFIELPEEVDEPLPIVLPEPMVGLVPIVLPEEVDGLVVLEDDEDGVLPVPVVVVVVLEVPLVPMVPVPVVPIVPVLLDGVVVVVLDGVVVVVLLPGCVVVVLELELDWAIAAPPAISNDAAAMAVVVFKNEPMV